MKKLTVVTLLCAAALLAQPRRVTTISKGDNLPTVCNAGELYYKTSATVGTYQCKSATWEEMASGVGLPGPAGPAGPVGPPGPSGVDGAPGTPGYSPNTLLSGGGVTWVTDLDFRVSASEYIIGNVQYTAPQTDITLSAADASNTRIDVIAVNDSGAVVVIAGTPAATPVKPAIDPATQLELSFITVTATATTPANVSSTTVYDEAAGGEWTASVSGASFTLNSTVNPYSGAKDIEATAATTGQYAQFQAASPVDLSTLNTLAFSIQSKAVWPSRRSLQIYFLSTGTRVGSIVTLNEGAFGFSSSNTTSYQQIVIPVNLFATTGTVNQIRVVVAGRDSTIGFYLDNVVLQGGVANAGAPSSMSWRGTWASTTSYAVNDTVYYLGTSYVAKAASVNSTPTAVNANWARISGPVASGTATLGVAEIASAACASVVTVAATGVVTTDVISWTPNADITAVTGYAPATTGGLSIYPYPTSGNVNFKVCNPTASAITPGAVTLNWRVAR